MIGYATIGTNDFDKAVKFYDAIAEEMGAKRAWTLGPLCWANGTPGGMLALCQPYNKEPATVGNGNMAALAAKDKTQVDRLHALALAQGSLRRPARAADGRVLRGLFPRPRRQ